MFSFVTVFTAVNLHIQSMSYIDNRNYTEIFLPGPLGYQRVIGPSTLSIIPTMMFLLNNWLADGLLVGLFDAASTRPGV